MFFVSRQQFILNVVGQLELISEFLAETLGYERRAEEQYGVSLSSGSPNEKRGKTFFNILHLIRSDESMRQEVPANLLSDSGRTRFLCYSLEKFAESLKGAQEEQTRDLKQLVSQIRHQGISDSLSNRSLTKIEKSIESLPVASR